MMLAVRRGLAGAAVGLVVLCGSAPALPARAETVSPTPVATAMSPSAAPTATSGTGSDVTETPLDNSRSTWALAGAGALAILAAALVFLRRR